MNSITEEGMWTFRPEDDLVESDGGKGFFVYQLVDEFPLALIPPTSCLSFEKVPHVFFLYRIQTYAS